MAEEKIRYFQEVTRSLQRRGFVAKAVDGEGLLPIQWQGQPLCKVTAEGSVRYTPGEIKGDAGNEAICQVADVAKITSEYMALMEAAPLLKAKGLEGGYKLLAEFNGAVLAAQSTKYGVQFATWERDFNRTGLCWGHYFEDYGKAKQDFATRSGLVAENRLFSLEQLSEVYRTVHETLDSELPITTERERLLKGVVEQIEQAVPDLRERVSLSNQKELEAGMQYGPTM